MDEFHDRNGKVKPPTTKTTEKPIPVLIGSDYEHVMGKATIVQTSAKRTRDDRGVIVVLEPEKVLITIEGSGDMARWLGDFVAANEVVALSFAGVPVQPRPHKETD